MIEPKPRMSFVRVLRLTNQFISRGNVEGPGLRRRAVAATLEPHCSCGLGCPVIRHLIESAPAGKDILREGGAKPPRDRNEMMGEPDTQTNLYPRSSPPLG